jgi:hypothetical protein
LSAYSYLVRTVDLRECLFSPSSFFRTFFQRDLCYTLIPRVSNTTHHQDPHLYFAAVTRVFFLLAKISTDLLTWGPDRLISIDRRFGGWAENSNIYIAIHVMCSDISTIVGSPSFDKWLRIQHTVTSSKRHLQYSTVLCKRG